MTERFNFSWFLAQILRKMAEYFIEGERGMKKLILVLISSFYIICCGENTTGQNRHNPYHHDKNSTTEKS
jgi:hypothetical protein